jgi:predicted nucleotide-binding protein
MPIAPDRAVQELTRLRNQAEQPEIQWEGPDHTRWKASVDAVMANSLPATSTTLQEFRGLRYSVGFWSGAPGEEERDRRYFKNQVGRAAALIDSAIFELELQGPTATPSHHRNPGNVSIFIVHGHNDRYKHELARLLDRTTVLDVTILHEQSNAGATVIEKLERHAQPVKFAVVLLTADDIGRASDEEQLKPRTRQNVILEAGFFIGLLGRSRVALLYESNVELPSDLAGLIYIPLDPAGGWRLDLLKELEAAEIEVDRARVP